MHTKFYPHKWYILPVIVFPVATIILTFLFVPLNEIKEDYIDLIVFVILIIIVLSPFAVKATTCVEVDNESILYKRNLFKKRQTINIKDIALVYLEYHRAKTIEITTIDSSKIKFDCTYQGLVALCGIIPETKISVFYISREFVPKKQREFLLSTNILKKGKHSSRGGLK